MFIGLSIVSVGVFSSKRLLKPQSRSQIITERPKEWLTSVPEVSSEVKDLEIINPRIVGQHTELAAVAFEIHNKSGRTVMAVKITCGKASISKDGMWDEENPTVVIEPHGTLTAEMKGELSPGNPIVITAAIYADGKEDGVESALYLMKRIRVRERERLRAEKGNVAGRISNQ